jgi:putative Mg2+ transporter-C (MgtC) family protein
MDALSQLHIVGLVAIAALLGGMIGVEREIANKPAGFRTHMLVAGASALLMKLGEVVAVYYAPEAAAHASSVDPTRIIQAIVTGISFLGAGTIIRHRHEEGVEGLTTAASILLSATIGICVALDKIILAVGVTLLALAVLLVMGRLERTLNRTREHRTPGNHDS